MDFVIEVIPVFIPAIALGVLGYFLDQYMEEN